MLLQQGAERVLNIFDLGDGELNILASVSLQLEKEHGDLLPCSIFMQRNLDDVFGTALHVGHDRVCRSLESASVQPAKVLMARTTGESQA